MFLNTEKENRCDSSYCASLGVPATVGARDSHLRAERAQCWFGTFWSTVFINIFVCIYVTQNQQKELFAEWIFFSNLRGILLGQLWEYLVILKQRCVAIQDAFTIASRGRIGTSWICCCLLYSERYKNLFKLVHNLEKTHSETWIRLVKNEKKLSLAVFLNNFGHLFPISFSFSNFPFLTHLKKKCFYPLEILNSCSLQEENINSPDISD